MSDAKPKKRIERLAIEAAKLGILRCTLGVAGACVVAGFIHSLAVSDPYAAQQGWISHREFIAAIEETAATGDGRVLSAVIYPPRDGEQLIVLKVLTDPTKAPVNYAVYESIPMSDVPGAANGFRQTVTEYLRTTSQRGGHRFDYSYAWWTTPWTLCLTYAAAGAGISAVVATALVVVVKKMSPDPQPAAPSPAASSPDSTKVPVEKEREAEFDFLPEALAAIVEQAEPTASPQAVPQTPVSEPGARPLDPLAPPPEEKKEYAGEFYPVARVSSNHDA